MLSILYILSEKKSIFLAGGHVRDISSKGGRQYKKNEFLGDMFPKL